MAKLNLYKGEELLQSVDKQEGKTTVTIENLISNTDYTAGEYQVSFSNDSGESSKVDVPAFKTDATGVVSVTLDVETLDLTVGETHQLVATIAPDNASNKNVSYEVDNDSIATVTQDGVVEAVGAGSAVVSVTTEDGSLSDVVSVTVKEPIPDAPANITVDPGETSADISV